MHRHNASMQPIYAFDMQSAMRITERPETNDVGFSHRFSLSFLIHKLSIFNLTNNEYRMSKSEVIIYWNQSRILLSENLEF